MADAVQDIKDEKGVARIKPEYVIFDVDSHYMVMSFVYYPSPCLQKLDPLKIDVFSTNPYIKLS